MGVKLNPFTGKLDVVDSPSGDFNELELNAGTAGEPSIAFAGDSNNTGIYSPGLDQIAISTNGTGRLFIDSSGNVGVGTSDSKLRLQVDSYGGLDGNANQLIINNNVYYDVGNKAITTGYATQISLNDNDGSIRFRNSASSVQAGEDVTLEERLRITSTGQLSHIGGGTSGSPAVGFNGSAPSNSLVIDSSGKVGVGTSSPSTLLTLSEPQGTTLTLRRNNSAAVADDLIGKIDFFNNDGSSPGARVTATVGAYAQATAGGTYLAFSTATNGGSNAERLRIDQSGNVGIGTTSPGRLLEVSADAAQISIKSANDTTSELLFGDSADDNIGRLYYDHSDNSLGFWTSASEKARIDSSGRLLVGTSSSSLPTGIQIQGYAGGSAGQGILTLSRGSALPIANTTIGDIRFYDNGSGFGAKIEAETDGPWASSDYPTRLVFSTTEDSESSPTERMRIDSDGNIGFGSSGYDLDGSNTVSINPTDGLIGFGMNGRDAYVTGAGGCYIYSGSGPSGTTLAGDLILQSRSDMSRSITFVTGGTPTKRMEIAGNGNVTVVGALSKGSGSFKISHPLPEKTDTHYLYHSFIEGPQADLIYRGHVQLVNGIASVNIDEAARMTEGTFEALCTNVCCFTSNESDWTAVRGSVSGNILTIEAQDQTSTADVCWMVVGERKDQHMLDTNWTDENGRVITERLKSEVDAPAEE